ncbi:MAG: sugar phosphate isomerase/epimerase [Planctomycetota bacterium]|nr:sugar phosphate isomerase/epimerase [Planctomycetota bacterium]
MPANLIACRPGSYGKYSAEAFMHLPKIGIKHVEIDVPPEDQWAKRQAELKKHKLKVSSVAGGVNLSKPDEVAAFSRLARAAKASGAKVIFLSVQTGGVPVEQCYRTLRELGDTARAYGATIGMETHPDMVTNGDVAAATMKGVNHPNVKLNYDSANIYYYNQGTCGVTEFKKFLPWLISVHLKETNGKPKTWYFPGLHEGEGIVNFPEIFRLCKEAKFYGPFTLEIEGCEGENLSQEQACARVANSVAYLKSIKAMA